LAEKHIKRESVFENILRTLLPGIYEEVIKKEDLKPVISPKIELVEAKDKANWKIRFTIAQKPEIILGNYKEVIKKAKANKKPEIWTPGKPVEAPKENKEVDAQKNLSLMLEALLKEVKCEISDIIIEEELEKRLAKFVDDLIKIGLTVDSYLKSNNLTKEQLRERFSREILDTYKLEFILAEISEVEKIVVEEADLAKLFTNFKTDAERDEAKKNAYFYSTILRKQKTLDYLNSL